MGACLEAFLDRCAKRVEEATKDQGVFARMYFEDVPGLLHYAFEREALCASARAYKAEIEALKAELFVRQAKLIVLEDRVTELQATGSKLVIERQQIEAFLDKTGYRGAAEDIRKGNFRPV